MSLNEFSLIERYFAARGLQRDDVVLGIGDDAALLQVPPGHELVAAVDTLVAGVHFPDTTSPADIGYKALAVNLSDLAAMGAAPAWATLALTLPEADPDWLAAFSEGFFAAAERFDVNLVGGDTTRGPLTITVQLQGFVPAGKAIRRSGAQPGDRIFVTGQLGDAGLGLAVAQGRRAARAGGGEALLRRLNRPLPRIEAGQQLRSLASAAIDISDGLLADLGHILAASGGGASLQLEKLPRSPAFRELITLNDPAWNELPLTAGDDFELLFTVPAERVGELQAALPGQQLTQIGVIEAEAGIRCLESDGTLYAPSASGYQHFS